LLNNFDVEADPPIKEATKASPRRGVASPRAWIFIPYRASIPSAWTHGRISPETVLVSINLSTASESTVHDVSVRVSFNIGMAKYKHR
jgi:hypothetical protein